VVQSLGAAHVRGRMKGKKEVDVQTEAGVSFHTLSLTTAVLLLAVGCGTGQYVMPPPGKAEKLAYIIKERETGPIVLVFPGRTSPADDPTLGIRGTALALADKLNGSIALVSWEAEDAVFRWTARQAALRHARGERAAVALVGHSWGGEAASRMASDLLRYSTVDEIAVLVTIDAINQGIVKCYAECIMSVLLLEGLFPHRLPLMAFREPPVPDGKRLVRHVNYYQLDSPHLHGYPVETATENHEVWFDRGHEIGHGNLDNYIMSLVVEDVVRAFNRGGAQ